MAITGRQVGVLTEKAWMAQVVELVRVCGWRVYHPWLSIRSERGWPDLALVRPGRFVLAELKAERGRVTPAQESWIAALREAGVEVHVWRPSDWDVVVEVLRSTATERMRCTGTQSRET